MMELNHSYLVKEKTSFNSSIQRIKVVEITKTCYKIEYETYNEYILKSDFDAKYKIIEDLGNLLNQSIINQFMK